MGLALALSLTAMIPSNALGQAPAIVSQPTNQSVTVGQWAVFNVQASGEAPLSYAWRRGGSPLPGRTTATLTLTVLQTADSGFLDVIVSNQFGLATSAVAVLTVNRSATTLETAFNPGANGTVNIALAQPDGKVLVGGGFTTLGGQVRNYLGRLNADGTVDTAFNPGADAPVSCLAVQADGKILVGGSFTTLAGQARGYLGRLNADGSLDTAFNPTANGLVSSLALQPDGKILVLGAFTTLGGQSRRYLGRLHADGPLDVSFNEAWPNGDVQALALQPDGKILVGGNFTWLGNLPRSRLGRLNSNGTGDTNFNDPGFSGGVYAIALQADGKILAGGQFASVGTVTGTSLARVNANGTVDTNFNPHAGSMVRSLAVQADGRILVSGSFPTLGGQARKYLGRLTPAGILDTTLNLDGNSGVLSVSLQENGKILVAGSFTTFAGQTQARLARLDNNAPGFQSVSFDGDSFRWLRGGSAPELAQVVAESWQAGVWSQVTNLARIAGGWQVGGLGMSASTIVRARAWLPGGLNNGSATLASVLAGAPVLTSQPLSRTNQAGTAATFSVTAFGSEPLGYQWYRNGAALTNGGGISGSTSASLSVNPTRGTDTGDYWVIVTNAYGAVTSSVAVLTVLDPGIVTAPASKSVLPGQSATFAVVAAGSGPLSYQWRRDGVALAAVTNSWLTLTNLGAAEAGSYFDVVVCGSLGCVTSSAAFLTVNLAGLDASFIDPQGSHGVFATPPQPDGRIVVGGDFLTFGGQNLSELVRVNSNATLDTGFTNASGLVVNALALQPDGRILVGGWYTGPFVPGKSCLVRLNTNGTQDGSFQAGADYEVRCLVQQADGKIVVGGSFLNLGGQSRLGLGRLNADGTLDSAFNPGTGFGVATLAVQADGKILLGGGFTGLGGQSRSRLARLNADGTLDGIFTPEANGTVLCLACQPDGKILIGGSFTVVNGLERSFIGRLNPDGTLDSAFNPGANTTVNSIVLQADGKILLGGEFTSLSGQVRSYLGRLHANGALDGTFDPATDRRVFSLQLQDDGKVLVGGEFTTLGGQSRRRLGRLHNSALAPRSVAYDGSSVTWLRGGSAPEFSLASLQIWQGVSWSNLTSLVRTADGWQAGGLAIPTNATLRLLGWIPGGYGGNSAGLVEAFVGAPWFSRQPSSRTNQPGTTASFSVTAVGSEPMRYQWYRDGVALGDGGNISGSTNAALTVSQVRAADAGQYTVVVTNAYGTATSSTAMLTVLIPAQGFTVQAGPNASLGITFSGTPNYPYVLEQATNLLPVVVWRPVLTNATDASGNWSATLTNSPSRASGFYRAVGW